MDDLDIVDYVKRLGYSQQQRSTLPSHAPNDSVSSFLASLKLSPSKPPPPLPLPLPSSLQPPSMKLNRYLDNPLPSSQHQPPPLFSPKKLIRRNISLNTYNPNKYNKYYKPTQPMKIVELKPEQTIDEAQQGGGGGGGVGGNGGSQYYRKLKQKERVRKRFIESMKECKKEILRESASLTLEPLEFPEKDKGKKEGKGERVQKVSLSKEGEKHDRYESQSFLPFYLRFSKKDTVVTESAEPKTHKTTIEYPVEYPPQLNLPKLRLPNLRSKKNRN